MAFIRLSDSYIDHPKFLALSASAFRLWHEGMAFCRKHQTDGLIFLTALQGFRYFQPVRVKELTTTAPGEGGPLWEAVENGYQVRNYLNWNLSRDEDTAQKQQTKDRVARWRKKQVTDAIPPPLRNASPDALVPSQVRSDLQSSFRKDNASNVIVEPTIEQRAAALLEKYADLYPQYCNGARLSVVRSSLDFSKAYELCATWDDTRLEKLVKVFLKSDDEWIERAGRSFKIFASKAQWCDEKLAAWEAQQRRPA